MLLRGGLTWKERGDEGCRRAGDIKRDSRIKIGMPMPNESDNELVLWGIEGGPLGITTPARFNAI